MATALKRKTSLDKNGVPKGSPEKGQFKCFHCEEILEEKEFYNSYSNAYKTKMPICKKCLLELFLNYKEKYESSHKSLFRICGMLDIYYYPTIIDTICDKVKDNPKMGETYILQEYIKQINSLPQYQNLSFQDSDVVNKEANVANIKITTSQQNELNWGRGYNPKQYERLNYKYEHLCKDSPHELSSDQIVLRNICKEDLRNEELIADCKDNSKSSSTLMNMIKLNGLDGKSRQKADNEKSVETFGLFIKKIEETMPADLYTDKRAYADWEGRGDYYKEQYIRPLRNMIENRRDFPNVKKSK